MKLCVVHCPQFIIKLVIAAALTVACLESGIAQTQESTAHEQSTADNLPPPRLANRRLIHWRVSG